MSALRKTEISIFVKIAVELALNSLDKFEVVNHSIIYRFSYTHYRNKHDKKDKRFK